MSREVSHATPSSLTYFLTCSRTILLQPVYQGVRRHRRRAVQLYLLWPAILTKACDAIHDELQDMLRQGQLGVSTQAQLYLLWPHPLWLDSLWLYSLWHTYYGYTHYGVSTQAQLLCLATLLAAYLLTHLPTYFGYLIKLQVRLLQSIKERHAALAKLL